MAHAGDYADARLKGHAVELLLTEALGGVHAGAVGLLTRLEQAAADGRDGTVYGRSLTAPRGFASHWLRLISTSIAVSVGDVICAWAGSVSEGLLVCGPDLAAA